MLALKSLRESARFPIFTDVSFTIIFDRFDIIGGWVVSVLYILIQFIKFHFIICFTAAKKGAVSEVERCFDEARELVRKIFFNVKIDRNSAIAK